MGVGRHLSYKKSLFFRNKGFSSINHIPSGDDDLFINKVATKHNTAVVIDPDAITRSIPKTTWGGWLRQKSRHYTTAKFYKPKHKFLLGLYFATQFIYYPLFAAALIFFDWRFVLPVFGTRFILQSIVLYKSMKKMGEKDLWPWFIFLDMWMFFYYIIFAPALPGAVMRCRPVGVLEMEDNNGEDEKIVAVPVAALHPYHDNIEDYTDVRPILRDQIEHFFSHYKDLEPGKWFKVKVGGNGAKAKQMILDGIERAKK